VKKIELFEAMVLMGIASLGIIEAIHLIYNPDPVTVTEDVGPGHFMLFLAVPLLITGLCYLIREYKKQLNNTRSIFDKQLAKKIASFFLITSGYAYFIGVIGYLLSTILYFILAFKLVGVSNWKVNIIVTLIISSSFYIIFVRLCNIIFPKSIFLGF